MGIMIYKNRAAASAAAATLIAAQMIEKTDCVLGLTASAMAGGVFQQLCAMTAAGILDWSEATIFHSSECILRRPGLPGVQAHYLSKHLYEHVGMSGARIHIPNYNAQNLQAACDQLENDLAEAGGMDILLLPLGQNGHLAFNSPAREFSALTHVELLPQSTMDELASILPDEADSASQAIIMGMSTLLTAKRIVLLALGKESANSATGMLSASITPALPASMLQLHPNVTYILDEEAAALL